MVLRIPRPKKRGVRHAVLSAVALLFLIMTINLHLHFTDHTQQLSQREAELMSFFSSGTSNARAKGPSSTSTAGDKKISTNRAHPHRGARDENGKFGYVPDLRPDRFQQSPDLEDKFRHACNLSSEEVEGVGGHEVIMKVREGVKEVGTLKKPRILCMVYTHSGSKSNLQAIVDTWAKDCDGFLAASNITIPSIGSVDVVHQGPEVYKNMWQKVRSMWAFVYDYFFDDFDYFHM